MEMVGVDVAVVAQTNCWADSSAEHCWMIRYMNMSYTAVSAHYTSIISIKLIISIMSIIIPS